MRWGRNSSAVFQSLSPPAGVLGRYSFICFIIAGWRPPRSAPPRCTVQLCRVRPCRLADNGVLWEGVFHLSMETGLILHVLSYRTGLVLISTGLPPEFIQADSPSFNEIR